MLLEGKQFSHYHILKLIGRGGMGEVYLAEDIQVPRQVAVKFIRITADDWDQETAIRALRLFWREASAVAMLDHANILPLHEYGETRFEDSALAYLIIPYCPEGSLALWLRQRSQQQPLTLGLIEHIVQQAALGLQCAHDHQVMHLDVKPANFLIRSRAANDAYPDLLLSDFGIARLASATSSLSQHIRGTPTYMAPEQWASQPVFASDQYALAIMIYELLTGNPPFQGAPMNVMYAHVHTLPRSICEINPLLPRALDLILQRALAKEPVERFPSMIDFAQAFQDMPGVTTLESDQTATPLLPPLDAYSSFSGNPPFTPTPAQTPLLPLSDGVSPLPLQDSASRSFTVARQIDHSKPQIDSSAKASVPLMPLSSKNSDSLSTLSLPTPRTPPPTLLPEPPAGLVPAVSTRYARRRPRVLVASLLLLSLLVLLGASIGAYTIVTGRWPGQSAQKKIVLQATTSTMGANTPITSQGNPGSTTTMATPTTTVTTTPTAQKNRTPTSGHAYPTYLPGHGTFALFDPLSQPNHWQKQADSDTNGSCQFTNGALQASEFSQVRTFHCNGPSSRNFAFEVQMTIIQGDCGGISFRYDIAPHNFYQFDICLDYKQYYLFSVANNNYTTLKEDDNSNFVSGLNQPLLLAVVAQGSSIKLFVNRQQITSVQDSTYTQGNLALTARDDQSTQTEVVYKNATLWTL